MCAWPAAFFVTGSTGVASRYGGGTSDKARPRACGTDTDWCAVVLFRGRCEVPECNEGTMAIPMKSMRSPRRRRAAPRNDGRFQPMLQSKTIRRATTTRNIAVGRAPTSEEALAPVDRPRARLRTDGLSCPEPLARGLHPPAVGLERRRPREPLLPRGGAGARPPQDAQRAHDARGDHRHRGRRSGRRDRQGRLGPRPGRAAEPGGQPRVDRGRRPQRQRSPYGDPRHEHAHGRGRRGDPSRGTAHQPRLTAG